METSADSPADSPSLHGNHSEPEPEKKQKSTYFLYLNNVMVS